MILTGNYLFTIEKVRKTDNLIKNNLYFKEKTRENLMKSLQYLLWIAPLSISGFFSIYIL